MHQGLLPVSPVQEDWLRPGQLPVFFALFRAQAIVGYQLAGWARIHLVFVLKDPEIIFHGLESSQQCFSVIMHQQYEHRHQNGIKGGVLICTQSGSETFVDFGSLDHATERAQHNGHQNFDVVFVVELVILELFLIFELGTLLRLFYYLDRFSVKTHLEVRDGQASQPIDPPWLQF